jgi:hypothetical protein
MPYNLYRATSGGDISSAVIGYFFTAEDGHKAVKSTGGGDGHVHLVGQVYDDFADYQLNNLDATRQRALAKLTAEERRLLGLQDY